MVRVLRGVPGNTKRLLKQKGLRVLRVLRVKTWQAASQVPYGEVPLLLFCIGRYFAVGKPFEGSAVAERAQWTTGMASSPRFFDAEAHGT